MSSNAIAFLFFAALCMIILVLGIMSCRNLIKQSLRIARARDAHPAVIQSLENIVAYCKQLVTHACYFCIIGFVALGFLVFNLLD